MHDAFRFATIVERLPLKIDCLATFDKGGRLLVGTNEGVLLDYDVRDGTGADPFSVNLLASRKNFSKKPIEQLQAIESLGVLLCLTDGVLNVHDLGSFGLKISLQKTKGANLFAVDFPNEQFPNHRICVSTKKKLLIYEWTMGEFIETRELAIPDKARSLVWCDEKICAGFTREYSLIHTGTGAMTELFPISRANPLSVLLPNKEILLAKDNVSVFVGFDGKATKKHGISWSEPPEAMGYSFPYALAIVPRGIEVRTIDSQNLVQTIVLPKPKIMTEGNFVFLAGQNFIWRLLPISLKTQVDQLVEEKEFEEAANLLDVIPDLHYKEKDEKMRNVRRLHAFHLFIKRQFEKSMNLFQELNADPAEVIGLFPDLLPQDLRSQFNYPFKIPNIEGESLEKALHALIKFLTDRRTMLSKLNKQDEESYFEKARQIDEEEDSMKREPATSFKELGQIIDTTLLKAYLLTNNNSLVGALLRVPNMCHLGESEKMLTNYKKFPELVDLYYGKGLHKRALQLLAKQGQKPNDPLSGIQPTINYLKRLNGDHIDLIIEYSSWVLQNDPEEGLRIFMDEYSDVTLPRDRVVAHLKEVVPRLVVPYLEYIINQKDEKNAEFHNQLIFHYLENVVKIIRESHGDVVEEPMVRSNKKLIGGEDRKKLLALLERSTSYTPEKMLSRFPTKALYEERAILLSRIGQHDQALAIYAHKLKSSSLAEEYCKKHYGTEKDQSPDVYLELLKVYLHPPPDSERMVDPALDLLTKGYDKIDPGKALELLPVDIDVKKVYPFVEAVLRRHTRQLHDNQIRKNLLKSEQLQVQEQRIYYQSRRAVITAEKVCPVCNKRIGNSVFACYPNGVVVHFICCKDKDVCPV